MKVFKIVSIPNEKTEKKLVVGSRKSFFGVQIYEIITMV